MLVFVTHATGHGIVFKVVAGDRQTTVRVALQGHAAVVVAQGCRRVEEAFGVGVLVRVGGKAVGGQAVADAELAVGHQVVLVGDIARAPVPGAVAVVLFALAVDARGAGVEDAVVRAGVAGRVLAAGVETQVEKTIVGQGQAFPAAELALQAVALGVAAKAIADVAAGVVLLEHDIDHPGDGIRAVLGGSTVTQDLHPRDGAQRDQAQIHRRRTAAVGQALAGDVGTAVPALAVDQHQHLVGSQAAQRSALGDGAGKGPLRRLREAERRRQRGERTGQILGAGFLQLLGTEHVHRGGALQGGDIAATGADHHHGVELAVAGARRLGVNAGRAEAADDQRDGAGLGGRSEHGNELL
ncbi:hypothetical protein D3C80_933030 [compost metagenome]